MNGGEGKGRERERTGGVLGLGRPQDGLIENTMKLPSSNIYKSFCRFA